MLSHARLQEIRDSYDNLDEIVSEYEEYLQENGLPFCDYRIYRTGYF
jgi:hypothetical protein